MIRRWMLLVGTAALFILVRLVTVVSEGWVNAGMLIARDGLAAQPDLASSTYPPYGALEEVPAAARAVQSLRWAMALDERNPRARWALGRAALAVGDGETAADALGDLAYGAGYSPLLYHDVIAGLSHDGRHEEVVALYETVPPPQRTQVISDTVALAYLDQERGKTGEGKRKRVLEQAKALRPADLYINYHLWRQAQETGDSKSATAIGETLAYFPMEAIDPTDERLLGYAAQVIPELLEEGIWTRGMTLNVVSVLVWQHPRADGIEQLLEQLARRRPAEPEWYFYLAELYHRRESLVRAKAAYQQTLAVDPGYTQAYLRLGMVSELQDSESANNHRLEEAAGWYTRYHEVAPDDLLGLKHLAAVCTALEDAGVEDESCRTAAERVSGRQGDRGTEGQEEGERRNSPAAVLSEELEARTDDRRIVAQLLDVSLEDVELGPNLVENGDFEMGTLQPEGWRFASYLGTSLHNGCYAGVLEPLSFDGQGARITELWSVPTTDGTTTSGDYFSEAISVSSGSWLIVSFYYRSSLPAEGSGFIYFGEWFETDPSTFISFRLGNTCNEWRKVIVTTRVDDKATDQSYFLLIRLWGMGEVWYDGLSLYSVPPSSIMLDSERAPYISGSPVMSAESECRE